MESMNAKLNKIIMGAQSFADFAREIEKMRTMRDVIRNTSAEAPTARISITSNGDEIDEICVGWALGPGGDARIYHDDPFFEPIGLTGAILNCLDEQIREDEATLADLVDQYKEELDEVIAR